jgi:hypothetical protein
MISMRHILQTLLLTLLLLLPTTLPAAQSDTPAGSVQILKGRATATSASGDIRNIRRGSPLYSDETISTAADSYSRLQLKDESWIMLRPGTRFYLESVEFEEETQEGKGFFSLLKGGFRAVTGLIKKKLNYRYSTTVATIGIRGTDFMARICNGDCVDIYPEPENGLYIEVVDASVVLVNETGETAYQAGQYIFIANSSAVPQLLDFRPDVFVQSPIPVADPADCL